MKEEMGEWVGWIANAGFNGVVLEYEDRFPWKSWPDTHRVGAETGFWEHLWTRCEAEGLEVVPLVQTLGHLQWLLKHKQYAHLRENRSWNELCPGNKETLPALCSWLDEVISCHPRSRFVHLGADETWNLASCPACRARAERSPLGSMQVYVDHVSALCRFVLDRGLRPIIWADMFWRQGPFEAAAQLPEGTVLVDWQYGGSGPWPTTAALRRTGRLVLGASAIRSGYEPHHLLPPVGMQTENVLGWHDELRRGSVAGLIHTVWGRQQSLMPLYGAWEGWLPAWIAAGNPAAWENHPLRPLLPVLDAFVSGPEWADPAAALEAIGRTEANEVRTQRALRYWKLAIEHRSLFHEAIRLKMGGVGIASVRQHLGVTPETESARSEKRREVLSRTRGLREDIEVFWRDASLREGGDLQEFLGVKVRPIEEMLEA